MGPLWQDYGQSNPARTLGSGLLTVVMYLATILGAVTYLSGKFANSARTMHRLVRNPLSVELASTPFHQLMNDSALCGRTNLTEGMTNFSSDGVFESPVGNKIREMDNLSFVPGTGPKQDVFERKLDENTGLYTKLGLKQFEAYQIAPLVVDSVSGTVRAPIVFAKVTIEPTTKAVSRTSGGQNSTGSGEASTVSSAGGAAGGSLAGGSSTSAAGSTTSAPSAAARCTGSQARDAINSAIGGCEQVFRKASPLILLFASKMKETLNACLQEGLSRLATQQATQCSELLTRAINEGMESALKGPVVSPGQLVSRGAQAARNAAQARITAAESRTAANRETLPPGWDADSGTGTASTKTVVSGPGGNFEVTRVVEAPLYVELSPDLTTPVSCYSPLASRSTCLDLGGTFDPNTAVHCNVSGGANGATLSARRP